MLTKSPGGSVFPYYYKGGEIHALKYGSFFNDEEKLFELMEAERVFIQQRPSQRLRIWTDFYETAVTDKVLEKYIDNIFSLSNQIIKLAVVGLRGTDERKLKGLLKKNDSFPPYKFFKDPEDAKTWLVSDK